VGTTLGPVLDVVRVDVVLAIAARERAAAVPRPERALEQRRHRALLAPDVERRALGIFRDPDEAAVAAQALHGLDGQIRSPRPSAEGCLVDVDHDLVAIGRGA
jgi:hypothetical protein